MTPERAEALRLGRVKYIPSESCFRGHNIRYAKTGQCVACLKDRYMECPDFYKQKAKEYRQKNQDQYKKTKKEYRAKFREYFYAKSCEWRKNNPQKKKLADQRWRDSNRDRVRSATRRWNERNRAKLAINSLKRKKTVIMATPKWADWDCMRTIYDLAVKKTSKTGTKHHVDHIIPLRHRDVCGLHVSANLRIIPATDNCRKSNKWFPTEHEIRAASEH